MTVYAEMDSNVSNATASDDAGSLIATLQNERRRLSEIIELSPAFICVLRGPEHVFELANAHYQTLVAGREIIGRRLEDAVPEVAGQGFIRLLDQVRATGEPYRGVEVPVMLRRRPDDDVLETRFLNFVYQPLREPDGRVSGVFVHGVDMTESVVTRERLRASESRYRYLFESMDEGFCVLEVLFDPNDPSRPIDYRYAEVNPAFEQQTGLINARGRTAREMMPSHESAWIELYGNVALTGHPVRYQNQAADLGRWFDVYAFRMGDGEQRRVAVLFKDVTDLARAAQDRERLLAAERSARGEAERASHMKDEFLATLSHELRTPLSAIMGWSQILRRGSAASTAPAVLAEGLETIERNARAQTQIIDDLLDMSRIISGKVTIAASTIDLVGVIRAAIATVGPAATAKGLTITFDRVAAPGDRLADQPAMVFADPNRLQQVFWNLLSNAVKFTPPADRASEPRVSVRLTREDALWRVDVVDAGEGISPEFLPHVFDRFRQADASITRRHGGLGLGLAIVKQLIELQGGNVAVASAGTGRGAAFSVRLPAAYQPADPTTAGDGSGTAAALTVNESRRDAVGAAVSTNGAMGDAWSADWQRALSGVRVLVVDDEPDARMMLARLLGDCGMIVHLAASADEALTSAERDRPDLLVTDIGMPHEDGYSVLRRVRALGPARGGNVPAIALTAYARADDRMRAIRAGFQQHVPKPVEPAELLTMIVSLVPRADARREEAGDEAGSSV